MSLDDFDRLTPGEFGEILRSWRREQERREAQYLQGMRLHASIVIQPHIKGKVRPQDLFRIPLIDGNPGERVKEKKLSLAERRARFAALKKERGYE